MSESCNNMKKRNKDAKGGTMKWIERKKSVVDIDAYIGKFDYHDITKEEAQFILQYAKGKYDLIIHDMEILEDKADLLIKYLGLVVGGLGVVNGYFGRSTPSHLSCWAIAGLSVGLFALCLAIWVIKPTEWPYTMSVQTLLGIIKEKRGDQIPEAALALAYEGVLVRLGELGMFKGKMLWLGYVLVIISIALLFLGLIIRGG